MPIADSTNCGPVVITNYSKLMARITFYHGTIIRTGITCNKISL